LGTKYLVVLCAGATLLLAKDALTHFVVKQRPCWSVTRLSSITFSCLSALLQIDIPWFLTEGKYLPLCSSYFLLGVSQLSGHNNHQLHASHQALFWHCCRGLKKNKLPHQLHILTSTWHQQAFSGAVAGEEVEGLCKGSFSHAHPLHFLLFCFNLFLLASFYIKNPKKLESFVVVFTCLLLVLLE
jgi:hypothetical protein